MFRSVLVANRGEIAVRIFRTLREMNITGVAVASEADASAAHVMAADRAEIIGPAPAGESYLNIEAVLQAARKHQCDAIHPGYGFLSENAGFAEACADAGITFIGPPASAIRAMGSKTESRTLMERAGVGVVPGYQPKNGKADLKEFAKQAEAIGYPVLVKASAGGGGKGMRAVSQAADLKAALSLAQTEAKAAFGDDSVYLEKLIQKPRHIEIQIFADARGATFHLGERECSIQRRHQKILEECPSPGVSPGLRSQMGDAAVQCAQAVGYRGAGTVEFLLDADGRFYFLEMNTRLQVEHPVTEMVYEVDLVRAQILTAAGEDLDFDPEHLSPRGHAIEARLYAEDPAQGFLPQTGPVLELAYPQRPGVRVDNGIRAGQPVEVFYDPLLAKMIAWAPTREEATRRLRAALSETVLLGLTTNQDFLTDVLGLDAWGSGNLHTGFLEENLPSWSPWSEIPPQVVALAAAAAGSRSQENQAGRKPSPWSTLNSWRSLE